MSLEKPTPKPQTVQKPQQPKPHASLFGRPKPQTDFMRTQNMYVIFLESNLIGRNVLEKEWRANRSTLAMDYRQKRKSAQKKSNK